MEWSVLIVRYIVVTIQCGY